HGPRVRSQEIRPGVVPGAQFDASAQGLHEGHARLLRWRHDRQYRPLSSHPAAALCRGRTRAGRAAALDYPAERSDGVRPDSLARRRHATGEVRAHVVADQPGQEAEAVMTDLTLLAFAEFDLPSYAARGISERLTVIGEASQLARTVNGDLIDLAVDTAFRK